MARALVYHERTANGGWLPTIAFLGTTKRLQARALPGDAARDGYMQALLRDGQRPVTDLASGERGTWEDWIDWALDALSNGHTSWATEVQPAPTVDALYEREILGVEPTPPARPDIRPESVVPESLGGYRKVRPA